MDRTTDLRGWYLAYTTAIRHGEQGICKAKIKINGFCSGKPTDPISCPGPNEFMVRAKNPIMIFNSPIQYNTVRVLHIAPKCEKRSNCSEKIGKVQEVTV